MAKTNNIRLVTSQEPATTWFQEVKGTNKTALFGGFGHFVHTMIMINGSRKLLETMAPTKAG